MTPERKLRTVSDRQPFRQGLGRLTRLRLTLALFPAAFAAVIVGCGGGGATSAVAQAPHGGATSACPQSPTVLRREPGAAVPSRWYGRRGGSLFLAAAPLYAGDNKIGWLRPRGTRIRLRATLHAGTGPRVVETISPAGYSGTSQPSGITFPVAGCWDVTATAGRAVSRFTIRVLPAAYRLDQGCFTLRDAARQSAAVVVASIDARVPDGRNAWVGAVVERVVAGRVPALPALRGGFSWWSWHGRHEIELLERSTDPRLAIGRRYLLFVTAPPGTPTGIACGGSAGAARLVGTRVVPLVRSPLWRGNTLAQIVREIRSAFQQR